MKFNLETKVLIPVAAIMMLASVGCKKLGDEGNPIPPVDPTATWSVNFVDSLNVSMVSDGDLPALCKVGGPFPFTVEGQVERHLGNSSNTSAATLDMDKSLIHNKGSDSTVQDADCSAYDISVITTNDLSNSSPLYGDQSYAKISSDSYGRCQITTLGAPAGTYVRIDVRWKAGVQHHSVNGVDFSDQNNIEAGIAYNCTGATFSNLSVKNGRRVWSLERKVN